MTDKVLFVDDEQNILKALERLFADEPYETEFCNDPLEALKRVAEKEYAVVVSDHRMPQMEGIAMLGAIRQKKPDISRIVLTGYADMKSVLSAINDGNVYQFITKPWDDSALKLAVKQGLEHYRLIAENRELLELTRAQNIQLEEWNHKLEKRVADRTEEIQKLLIRLRHNFCQLVQVMLDVMELFDPYLAGHSRRVAELVVNIGKHLDLNDEKISRLETAAKLHDIGLLSLPRSLIGVRQSLLSPTDSALLQKHTRMGKELLGHIEELEQVATIIYHHHENWDGSGYPEKLSEEQIPLESRIIHVANEYDNMINREQLSPERAISRIKSQINVKYDINIVAAFVTIKDNEVAVDEDELPVRINDLTPGQVLSRDLKTTSGSLLLQKSTTLSQLHIFRIQHFHKMDPIFEQIYVLRNPNISCAE